MYVCSGGCICCACIDDSYNGLKFPSPMSSSCNSIENASEWWSRSLGKFVVLVALANNRKIKKILSELYNVFVHQCSTLFLRRKRQTPTLLLGDCSSTITMLEGLSKFLSKKCHFWNHAFRSSKKRIARMLVFHVRWNDELFIIAMVSKKLDWRIK